MAMENGGIKVLIVEDDFVSRQMIKAFLDPLGSCDVVVDGSEAVQAFRTALEDGNGYDLICLDIMMPDVDGHEALNQIREIENEKEIKETDRVKIVMVSALDDPKNIFKAYYKGGADAYIVKPVEKEKLLEEVRSLGLVSAV